MAARGARARQDGKTREREPKKQESRNRANTHPAHFVASLYEARIGPRYDDAVVRSTRCAIAPFAAAVLAGAAVALPSECLKGAGTATKPTTQ